MKATKQTLGLIVCDRDRFLARSDIIDADNLSKKNSYSPSLSLSLSAFQIVTGMYHSVIHFLCMCVCVCHFVLYFDKYWLIFNFWDLCTIAVCVVFSLHEIREREEKKKRKLYVCAKIAQFCSGDNFFVFGFSSLAFLRGFGIVRLTGKEGG